MGFIGASSIESGPMPNMAITMLGVVWIGVLGAYAGMLLDFSNVSTTLYDDGTPWGTDTLVLLALAVVANDVGRLLPRLGVRPDTAAGVDQPGKSVEGFLGGTILTMLVMVIVSIQETFDTWSQTSDLLFFGLVVSVLAPLGDLTESMFKRNLDVKDFGTIVKGHGGVLDRFDGFLFTLPGVYYLFLVLHAVRRVRPELTSHTHMTVRVAIAGSTGSIGTQTIEVVRAENAREAGSYAVTALSAGGGDVEAVLAQIDELRPDVVAIADGAARTRRSRRRAPGVEVTTRFGRPRRRRRCRRERRRRFRRADGHGRDAAGGQTPGPRQQGEPDRSRTGRPTAPVDSRCRDRARRQRTLRVASVPAVVVRPRTRGAPPAAHRQRRTVPRQDRRRVGGGHRRVSARASRRGRWGRRSRSTAAP